MSTVQKIIKALAIALATFIIFSIVSGIVSAIMGIAGVSLFFNWIDDKNIGEIITTEKTFNIEEIKNIKLSSGIENIEIIESDEFRVVAENVPESYKCEVVNETLTIDSTSNSHFKIKRGSKIIVYIPDNFEFNNANLKFGVGEANIGYLKAENLEVTCGAGEVNVDYIEATKKATIECGVGEFNIKDSKLSNLDFDAGVGEVNITSELNGKCSIESGVGELNVTLKNFDELLGKITTEKGIGALNVNRRNYSGKQEFGTGSDTTISIEGGVGEVNVEY